MRLKYSSAVLMVKDIAISRKFYEQLLGQPVQMDHGECVSFGGFALWDSQYAHQVMKLAPATEARSSRFELYFESEELDVVRQTLLAVGTSFVHDIVEQPWGQRVLRAFDPDGHIVEIGEPMEFVIRRYLRQGMLPAAVSQRTSMPLEIVEQLSKTPSV